MARSGYLPNSTRWLSDMWGRLLNHIENHRWALVKAYTLTINSAIDDDYKLPINTEAYSMARRRVTTYECPICKEEIEHPKIQSCKTNGITSRGQVCTIIQTSGTAKLTDTTSWLHCQKWHTIKDTKVRDRSADPYEVVGCMPAPPEHNPKNTSRDFEAATEKWSHIVMQEMGCTMAKWRREYTGEEDELEDEYGEED